MAVFERLDAVLQADLLAGLQEADVAEVFAGLSPDDRVALLDELPASVAHRLISGLSEKDRALTSTVLGYPQGAVGRYMSPEFVVTHPSLTVGETLARVRARLDDAESVYTIPVTDAGRHLVGVVSLRDLLRGGGTEPLRRPYLATPVGSIVRARVVWLLVLALGATLIVRVIGLTLLGACTRAAATGGLMPLLGKTVKADPAVFSNPFISTFVDAMGLVIYFLIATSILGL
nr:magnesium transporter [Arthrobacter wenxiniae]